MKKLIFLFSIIMLFTSILYSQWEQCDGIYGGSALSLTTLGNYIFAGTSGNGIFITSNNGTNWTQSSLNNISVLSLAVSGNTVFAGTGGSGVYFTTNNGLNWTQTSLNKHIVSSLTTNGNYVFAGTEITHIPGGTVYVSTNSGNTWTQTSISGEVWSLAVSGNNIFAGIYAGGVYRSTDNGTSWTLTSLTDGYVRALAISGNNIFAGGENVYLSTDNGTTWSQTALTGFTIAALAINGNNIFAGTESNGLYFSSNSGTSWIQTALNGDISSLTINGNYIFAGADINGVYFSTNNGTKWAQTALNHSSILSLATNGINLFAGTSLLGVYISSNNGITWSHSGLDIQYIYSIAESGNNILAGTYNGLYLSTNNGFNWNQISTIVTNVLAISGNYIYEGTDFNGVYYSTNNGTNWIQTSLNNKVILSLAISGNNIFAGNSYDAETGDTGGVYHSTDNGISWTYSALNNSGVTSLCVLGNNIFAGTEFHHGVYISTDNGSTWTQTSLNNLTVNSLATYGNYVFAGTDSNGVYLSSDNGTTWINEGLKFVRSLLISNNYIVAGTMGNSVWRRPISDFFVTHSISGTIFYRDNNQPVTNGYVKALKYDRSSDQILTMDSTHILSNGTYVLSHVPQDSIFIMAFNDDASRPLYVPTYYPSTTNWQNATVSYPTANQNNTNVLVYRINNVSGPYHIAGSVLISHELPIIGLKGAIVYATMGSNFKAASISSSAGAYRLDSLSAGTYVLFADRIGYIEQKRTVTIPGPDLDTINFTLTTSGIIQTGIEIPKSYFLGNNYPNPFNPKTTIRFGIPGVIGQKPQTRLVIYDILGREVSVLVNEKLDAGNYKVVWDGSNYSSGVYFYKLIITDPETPARWSGGSSGLYFTETKKLVLLK